MAGNSTAPLNERQHTMLEKAQTALAAGNADYALQACGELLGQAPRCVAARKLQREAQLFRFERANRLLARTRAGISASPFIFGVNEEDPAHSFENAEKILSVDPTSSVGLKLLGQSAELLHWSETAVFAYQALHDLRPRDRESLLMLGRALLAAGSASEALVVAQQVLNELPAEPTALVLQRDASVAHVVADGSWKPDSSYRDRQRATSA